MQVSSDIIGESKPLPSGFWYSAIDAFSSKWCLCFRFSGSTFVGLFLIYHACYIVSLYCP